MLLAGRWNLVLYLAFMLMTPSASDIEESSRDEHVVLTGVKPDDFLKMLHKNETKDMGELLEMTSETPAKSVRNSDVSDYDDGLTDNDIEARKAIERSNEVTTTIPANKTTFVFRAEMKVSPIDGVKNGSQIEVEKARVETNTTANNSAEMVAEGHYSLVVKTHNLTGGNESSSSGIKIVPANANSTSDSRKVNKKEIKGGRNSNSVLQNVRLDEGKEDAFSKSAVDESDTLTNWDESDMERGSIGNERHSSKVNGVTGSKEAMKRIPFHRHFAVSDSDVSSGKEAMKRIPFHRHFAVSDSHVPSSKEAMKRIPFHRHFSVSDSDVSSSKEGMQHTPLHKHFTVSDSDISSSNQVRPILRQVLRKARLHQPNERHVEQRSLNEEPMSKKALSNTDTVLRFSAAAALEFEAHRQEPAPTSERPVLVYYKPLPYRDAEFSPGRREMSKLPYPMVRHSDVENDFVSPFGTYRVTGRGGEDQKQMVKDLMSSQRVVRHTAKKRDDDQDDQDERLLEKLMKMVASEIAMNSSTESTRDLEDLSVEFPAMGASGGEASKIATTTVATTTSRNGTTTLKPTPTPDVVTKRAVNLESPAGQVSEYFERETEDISGDTSNPTNDDTPEILMEPGTPCDYYDNMARVCWYDREVGATITLSLKPRNGTTGLQVRWQKVYSYFHKRMVKIDIKIRKPPWNVVLGGKGLELRLSPITNTDLDKTSFFARVLKTTVEDGKKTLRPVTEMTFKINIIPIDTGTVYTGEEFKINIENFILLPPQSMKFQWLLQRSTREIEPLPSNLKVSLSGRSLTMKELKKDQHGILSCIMYSSTDLFVAKRRFKLQEPETLDRSTNQRRDVSSPKIYLHRQSAAKEFSNFYQRAVNNPVRRHKGGRQIDNMVGQREISGHQKQTRDLLSDICGGKNVLNTSEAKKSVVRDLPYPARSMRFGSRSVEKRIADRRDADLFAKGKNFRSRSLWNKNSASNKKRLGKKRSGFIKGLFGEGTFLDKLSKEDFKPNEADSYDSKPFEQRSGFFVDRDSPSEKRQAEKPGSYELDISRSEDVSGYYEAKPFRLPEEEQFRGSSREAERYPFGDLDSNVAVDTNKPRKENNKGTEDWEYSGGKYRSAQTAPKTEGDPEGVTFDDQEAKLASRCSSDRDCSPHARCTSKTTKVEGHCRCVNRYRGNGVFCEETDD